MSLRTFSLSDIDLCFTWIGYAVISLYLRAQLGMCFINSGVEPSDRLI